MSIQPEHELKEVSEFITEANLTSSAKLMMLLTLMAETIAEANEDLTMSVHFHVADKKKIAMYVNISRKNSSGLYDTIFDKNTFDTPASEILQSVSMYLPKVQRETLQ